MLPCDPLRQPTGTVRTLARQTLCSRAEDYQQLPRRCYVAVSRRILQQQSKRKLIQYMDFEPYLASKTIGANAASPERPRLTIQRRFGPVLSKVFENQSLPQKRNPVYREV